MAQGTMSSTLNEMSSTGIWQPGCHGL